MRQMNLGAIHMETLVCKHTRFASFWPIVHMDPALFWNLVSGWKNLKMLLLCSHVDSESACFVYPWRNCPTPLAIHLLTPQCLITTIMVDYMLVFVPQIILSLLGLLGQNIMLLCHYTEWKRIMDNQLVIFISLFCSVSPSVCIQCTSFMCMLGLLFSVFGEFQLPPMRWAMNYNMLSCFQWIRLDENILTKRF